MASPSTANTTIIHRPFGGLVGYRRVVDRATRVTVHAFPMADLPLVNAAGFLTTPGAYVMTDGRTVYIGESSRPARRLGEHAADPTKAFARDVFVVAGNGAGFDKLLALDLQYRLTSLAVEAGTVKVMKGLNPSRPDMSDDDRATHDRIVEDAFRLLFDARCPIFVPTGNKADVAAVTEPPARGAGDASDDGGGPMRIGITTTPIGTHEFELRYLGVWARGYRTDEGFVVSAGSEVRVQTNDSVDPQTRKRREQLLGADVLASIPGIGDRRRLVAAVCFSTETIASKVICGAHTAARWVALEPAKAVWLAA